MIVAFDASILIYLFDQSAAAPISKDTGQPIERCGDRVSYLISMLQKDKSKIIIPTPALGEALVRAQDGAPERLLILEASRHFRIAPFDKRAAVEFAAIQAARRSTGTGRVTPRPKAKFDDQIFAISVVEGASIIYSDDSDIKKMAGTEIKVVGIEEFPLPPEDSQWSLPFVNQ